MLRALRSLRLGPIGFQEHLPYFQDQPEDLLLLLPESQRSMIEVVAAKNKQKHQAKRNRQQYT
jgi:hypothetical protein